MMSCIDAETLSTVPAPCKFPLTYLGGELPKKVTPRLKSAHAPIRFCGLLW